MKPWQKDQQHRALERRREILLAELKRDAARLREERTGERTDVTPDLDQADLSRDQHELRELEAARCIDCQRRHEKTYRA